MIFLFIYKESIQNSIFRKGCVFMKFMMKSIILLATTALAVNSVMPSINGKTKKRLKKRAKRLRHNAEDMLERVMVPLR